MIGRRGNPKDSLLEKNCSQWLSPLLVKNCSQLPGKNLVGLMDDRALLLRKKGWTSLLCFKGGSFLAVERGDQRTWRASKKGVIELIRAEKGAIWLRKSERVLVPFGCETKLTLLWWEESTSQSKRPSDEEKVVASYRRKFDQSFIYSNN